MKFIFFFSVLIIFSVSSHENYYLLNYERENTNVMLLFSAHTTRVQDNELKRLNRILNKDISEREKSHLTKQIEAKINTNRDVLELERSLVMIIEQAHEQRAFNAVLGEFSEEYKDRYLLRIEVASFVRDQLKKHLTIEQSKIDDFILLLTGEDIFPLLKGNKLHGLPLIPTEDASLHAEISTKLASCKGMMGIFGLSQSEEAQYLSKLLEPFYRPRPEQYEQYLMIKAILHEKLSNNGLLRLRAGIESKDEVSDALSNCDALFDTRRDDLVVSILENLDSGNFLLTRGIAHRWLLDLSL